MEYLPTLRVILKVNVGKYSIHGAYGNSSLHLGHLEGKCWQLKPYIGINDAFRIEAKQWWDRALRPGKSGFSAVIPSATWPGL